MLTTGPNTNEIDLLSLLARFTRFLVKNKLTIILSVASCLALSLILYKTVNRVFSSEMVLESKYLSEAYSTHVVRSLNRQLEDSNYDPFATALNLTPADASLVKSIRVATPFSEKVNMPEDERRIFIVTVEILDPLVLPKLQKGLIYFFENLDFVKVRVEENRKGYLDLVDRIDADLSRLENPTTSPLSGVLYSVPLKKVGQPVQMVPMATSIFLVKERNDALSKLHTVFNGVEVIHGFTPSGKSISPKLSVFLAAGLSGGVILTLFLLGFKTLRWIHKEYPV